MKRIMIFPATFALIVCMGLFAVACGEDASVDSRDHGSAKAIINMPDHFANVALKCRGTKGVYVSNNTSAGAGSVFVLLDDPECHG